MCVCDDKPGWNKKHELRLCIYQSGHWITWHLITGVLFLHLALDKLMTTTYVYLSQFFSKFPQKNIFSENILFLTFGESGWSLQPTFFIHFWDTQFVEPAIPAQINTDCARLPHVASIRARGWASLSWRSAADVDWNMGMNFAWSMLRTVRWGWACLLGWIWLVNLDYIYMFWMSLMWPWGSIGVYCRGDRPDLEEP